MRRALAGAVEDFLSGMFRASVQLGFPADAAGEYFPNLSSRSGLIRLGQQVDNEQWNKLNASQSCSPAVAETV